VTEYRVEGRRYLGRSEMRGLSRKPTVPQCFGSADSCPKGFQEKLLALSVYGPVPQTDTGGQGEDPEVLE
jgi:hypothetical protein